MQDPLTSSFRWGETFDTAPTSGSPEEKRVLRVKFRKESLRSGSAPAARGGSRHPDERFPEEKSTELAKREKNFAFYLHVNLKSKGLLVSC